MHVVRSYEFGGLIQTHDGAQWLVHPNDRSTVIKWKMDDPITITQNSTLFSCCPQYQYRFLNARDYSEVRVNVHLAPKYDGERTYWICKIDKEKGTLVLKDRSFWKVHPSDLPIFENWLVHDTVIIGTNYSSCSSESHILINVCYDPTGMLPSSSMVRVNQMGKN